MFNLLRASKYGDAICLRISSRISFGFFAFAIGQSSFLNNSLITRSMLLMEPTTKPSISE